VVACNRSAFHKSTVVKVKGSRLVARCSDGSQSPSAAEQDALRITSMPSRFGTTRGTISLDKRHLLQQPGGCVDIT
jgi:hypothetical protein